MLWKQINSTAEMKKKYKEYQDYLVKANKDGILTKEEKEIAQGMIDNIYKEIKAKYDEQRKNQGTFDDNQSEQKATINEAKSLTEDTGSQLVGRLTAVQIGVENANSQRDTVIEKLNLLNITMSDFREMMNKSSYNTVDNRNFIADSYQSKITITFPDEKIEALRGEVISLKECVSSMQTIQAESLIEQRTIAENTTDFIRPIKSIQQDTSDIKRNTDKL